MKALSFTAASLLLFGAFQAPITAAPALSTTALQRIERMLDPVLGPPVNATPRLMSRVQSAGSDPAGAELVEYILEPLRPEAPGQCVASLNAPGNGKKLWAIYMIGTDLESRGGFATTNLDQLVEGWRALGNPSDAEVFIAFGGADKDGWRGVRWATMAQIVADAADGIYGNEADRAYTLVDHAADMGDAATFRAFIDHVHHRYGQASRRFLSFWNHGASYNKTPGIGPDQMTDEILDLTRINQVLMDSGSCWHLTGFDACLMASLQSARALKDVSAYLIASEELEPGHGWNYHETLSAWLNQPDVPAAGRAMVDAFVRNDIHPYEAEGKTLSLVDLTVYDQVARAMSDIGIRLADVLLGPNPAPVIQAFANSARYSASFTIDPSVIPPQASIDAVDFLQLNISRVKDPDLSWRLNQTVDHLKAMVVHSADDGTRANSHGIAIAPLDMNPVNATEQVRVGLITPGWGELVHAWNDLQARALDQPRPLAITQDVEGNSLSFTDRWGRLDWNPFLTPNMTLGAVGGFASPYLMEVTAAFGELRADGSFLVLGEDETDPLVDGRVYFPSWNGLALHFADGDTLVQVPLFHDGISGIAAGLIGFPDADPDEEPELGVLMIDEGLEYAVAPILILENDGWIMGRPRSDYIEAGDEISFLTVLVAPDGAMDLEEAARHRFASAPTAVIAPLTWVDKAWAFTGYTVADAMAISDFVEVKAADRVINWASETYAGVLTDLEFDSLYSRGFYGRCNEERTLCLGERNNRMLRWDGQRFVDMGFVSSLLERAQAAGF